MQRLKGKMGQDVFFELCISYTKGRCIDLGKKQRSDREVLSGEVPWFGFCFPRNKETIAIGKEEVAGLDLGLTGIKHYLVPFP